MENVSSAAIDLISARALWVIRQDAATAAFSAATEALVEGHDGQGLRELAGASPQINVFELRVLIDDALNELGLAAVEMTGDEAKLIAAHFYARRAIEGNLRIRELTSWAHRVVGHEGHPIAQKLVDLDDAYDDGWGEEPDAMQVISRLGLPRVLSTLDCLEGLDSRPMEWLHVNYSDERMGRDNRLPRTHREMALSVEDGARKDDVGTFYPSWGYYVSMLGFLAGSDRRVCPFEVSTADGDQDGRSSDSFNLNFLEAAVPGRGALVDGVASLIDLWEPTRGGLFSSAITKKNRDQPIW